MKRFLIVLSLLVAVAFAFAACHRGAKGPCCPGGPAGAAKMEKCADCPHKDNCACAKGAVCKDCPKASTCQCAKGGPCTCPAGCTCDHCKELKHGPVGAPEGAPAKK